MSRHVHVQHIHMIQQGDGGYRPSTTAQRARSGERLCLMTKQDIVNSVAKRALAIQSMQEAIARGMQEAIANTMSCAYSGYDIGQLAHSVALGYLHA